MLYFGHMAHNTDNEAGMKNKWEKNYRLMWESSHTTSPTKDQLSTLNSNLAALINKNPLDEEDIVALVCAKKIMDQHPNLKPEKQEMLFGHTIRLFNAYRTAVDQKIHLLSKNEQSVFQRIEGEYEATKSIDLNPGLEAYGKTHATPAPETASIEKTTVAKQQIHNLKTESNLLISEADKREDLKDKLDHYLINAANEPLKGKEASIDVLLAGALLNRLQKNETLSDVFKDVQKQRQELKNKSGIVSWNIRNSMSPELSKIVNEGEKYVETSSKTSKSGPGMGRG